MINDLNGWCRSSIPSTSTAQEVRYHEVIARHHTASDLPLMKHWNSRKKKYPREPMLQGVKSSG